MTSKHLLAFAAASSFAASSAFANDPAVPDASAAASAAPASSAAAAIVNPASPPADVELLRDVLHLMATRCPLSSDAIATVDRMGVAVAPLTKGLSAQVVAETAQQASDVVTAELAGDKATSCREADTQIAGIAHKLPK